MGGLDLAQIGATIAILAPILTGMFAAVQVFLNKKLRTPADKQGELTNIFNILQKTIEDNRTDKKANDETIQALRSYVETMEAGARADQELISSLYGRIHELEALNAEKDRRIAELESELLKLGRKIVTEETVYDTGTVETY